MLGNKWNAENVDKVTRELKSKILSEKFLIICRYTLGSKPGKENTKERGELEVKIGFIVKAGSLTDLSHKERHKSSLGQLSTAAHSIGGSLLSIGSFEKRKGLKKLAKSIGNRVKGKSKHNLDKGDDLNEKDERKFRTTRQEPGEADPGVISEDEDEFTVTMNLSICCYLNLLYNNS